MKYLIASDIHGSAYWTERLVAAIESEQPDRIVLLGDLLYHGPRNDLPRDYAPKRVIPLLNALAGRIIAVRGNCDAEVDQMVLDFPVMADYATLFDETGRELFLTHGHVFGAGMHNSVDHAPALPEGSALVYGHTHIKVNEECEAHPGLWRCNPGSVSIPKDGSHNNGINAGGAFTGGSTARSVGVFSRKQELDELRSKLTKLEQKRTEAEKELAARKAEVDNLSAQLAGAEGEGMNAATEHVRANLELERLTKAAAQYDETARSIEAEIAAQQAAVTRNETARTEAEKARTDAEAELAQYTAELAALGESTGSLTAEREKITGELSEKQLQRLADEKDVGLHEAALEGLRSRTGEADARARELQTAIEAAKAKIEANALKIAEMERVRGDNQQKIAAAEETIRSANAARLEREAAISKLGQDNRALTDERERMSGEMARLAERRTAAETELNDTNSKLWEEYQLTESEARSQCVPFESLTELRRSVTEVRGKIRALGNVNVGAIDEYKEVRERYEFMKAQVTDVEKAKAELTKMIAELCSEMQELFTASFKQINANFQQIFKELFGGGHARLYLSDEANVLESGIEIEVSPPGKVIKNLSALSGGEQALVAISIYFAILRVNPAPFCFLDEIEAALDDVNVARYAQYLRRMTDRTQFIVITHRRGTMEAADVLYGVTMQEDGVSKILRLDLDNVSADLIT